MILGNKEYKDEDVQNEIFDKRIQGQHHTLKEEYDVAETTEDKLNILAKALGLK